MIDYVIEDELPRARELAEKNRVPLYYIVLTADAEEIERRIRERGDVDLIERALFLKKKLENMPENQGHIYDNTGKKPEDDAPAEPSDPPVEPPVGDNVPAADVLDVVFNNDGTAYDASELKVPVEYISGEGLVNYYHDHYKKYVTHFSHKLASGKSESHPSRHAYHRRYRC